MLGTAHVYNETAKYLELLKSKKRENKIKVQLRSKAEKQTLVMLNTFTPQRHYNVINLAYNQDKLVLT